MRLMLALLGIAALIGAALILSRRSNVASPAGFVAPAAAVPGKPARYTTASGEHWRVTRTAGAVPSSSYEQSYARLEHLGPADEVLWVFNFEERAWVRPDGAERTWVDFSYDARGELQVLQHQKQPSGAETTTRFVWNGTAFDREKSEANPTLVPDGRTARDPP
jgi:hypothetical protein